jgi:hypothetical protein
LSVNLVVTSSPKGACFSAGAANPEMFDNSPSREPKARIAYKAILPWPLSG